MFRYYASAAALDSAVATCERALVLAERLQRAEVIEETRVVHGYLRMVRAIYWIAAAQWDSNRALDHLELAAQMDVLQRAASQTNAALERWETLFGANTGGSRFDGTLRLNNDLVSRVAASLTALGVELASD